MNAGARLFRWVIYGNHPGSIVLDCGAYAIRPYASDSRFLSVRVGAYCIRPIRRPRKGDGGGYGGWNVTSVFGTAEGAEGA